MKTAMVLLYIAGIWDLEKKEIPVVLLAMLSGTALLIWSTASAMDQLSGLVMIGILVLGSWKMVKSGKVGSGDTWIVACMALIWPIDVFWKSLSMTFLILSSVAMGIWAVTGDTEYRIPMVPFLVLGYWI